MFNALFNAGVLCKESSRVVICVTSSIIINNKYSAKMFVKHHLRIVFISIYLICITLY